LSPTQFPDRERDRGMLLMVLGRLIRILPIGAACSLFCWIAIKEAAIWQLIVVKRWCTALMSMNKGNKKMVSDLCWPGSWSRLERSVEAAIVSWSRPCLDLPVQVWKWNGQIHMAHSREDSPLFVPICSIPSVQLLKTYGVPGKSGINILIGTFWLPAFHGSIWFCRAISFSAQVANPLNSSLEHFPVHIPIAAFQYLVWKKVRSWRILTYWCLLCAGTRTTFDHLCLCQWILYQIPSFAILIILYLFRPRCKYQPIGSALFEKLDVPISTKENSNAVRTHSLS
jgi:hypothetical protein